MIGWRWEGKSGVLAEFTWSGLPYTEEEKAEAREFEEDQVAGRLKDDVVCVAGRCGRKRWGWSGSWDLTSVLSLQLEQRGRLQKSVAKEVSRQGTLE